MTGGGLGRGCALGGSGKSGTIPGNSRTPNTLKSMAIRGGLGSSGAGSILAGGRAGGGVKTTCLFFSRRHPVETSEPAHKSAVPQKGAILGSLLAIAIQCRELDVKGSTLPDLA